MADHVSLRGALWHRRAPPTRAADERAAQNPVPRKGTWAEISGDVMLKQLLCMVRPRRRSALSTALDPANAARLLQGLQTINNPYTGDSLTIDPRSLAQRILEARAAQRRMAGARTDVRRASRRERAQIRVHLAKEFVEDLKFVKARFAEQRISVARADSALAAWGRALGRMRTRTCCARRWRARSRRRRARATSTTTGDL